jgi:hypothetical protein
MAFAIDRALRPGLDGRGEIAGGGRRGFVRKEGGTPAEDQGKDAPASAKIAAGLARPANALAMP